MRRPAASQASSACRSRPSRRSAATSAAATSNGSPCPPTAPSSALRLERSGTPHARRGPTERKLAEAPRAQRFSRPWCVGLDFPRRGWPATARRTNRNPHGPRGARRLRTAGAGVVIDDDGQVALTLAMADLVDADAVQSVEQVELAPRVIADAIADRADGAPRDTHQLRDRALRCVDRKPRRLILKRPGEPRPMPGPRNRTDDHAVTATAHPLRIGLQERQRRPEIQRAPAPASGVCCERSKLLPFARSKRAPALCCRFWDESVAHGGDCRLPCQGTRRRLVAARVAP